MVGRIRILRIVVVVLPGVDPGTLYGVVEVLVALAVVLVHIGHGHGPVIGVVDGGCLHGFAGVHLVSGGDLRIRLPQVVVAVQFGGPHGFRPVFVLVIGHLVDVQIDVRALGLVEGVVVFPVLGPRHGLGVPKAVGDGDGLHVVVDAGFIGSVRVGHVLFLDAHGISVQQFLQVVLVLVAHSFDQFFPIVAVSRGRNFFPVLVPDFVDLVVDHRAGQVILGKIEEGVLVLLRGDFLAVGDMLLLNRIGVNGRLGAAKIDVTVTVIVVLDFSSVRSVVVCKGQLQIGGNAYIRERLPQGAGAVLPHLSGGEVHGAQAAVVHHEDVLAGEVDLAVGGLVAVVVGFVLVDIFFPQRIPAGRFVLGRNAVFRLVKRVRRKRNLVPVYAGFQDVDAANIGTLWQTNFYGPHAVLQDDLVRVLGVYAFTGEFYLLVVFIIHADCHRSPVGAVAVVGPLLAHQNQGALAGTVEHGGGVVAVVVPLRLVDGKVRVIAACNPFQQKILIFPSVLVVAGKPLESSFPSGGVIFRVFNSGSSLCSRKRIAFRLKTAYVLNCLPVPLKGEVRLILTAQLGSAVIAVQVEGDFPRF